MQQGLRPVSHAPVTAICAGRTRPLRMDRKSLRSRLTPFPPPDRDNPDPGTDEAADRIRAVFDRHGEGYADGLAMGREVLCHSEQRK